MRTEAAKPKPDRLIELDVLRFLAALAVVIYHYTYRYATAEVSSLSWLQSFTRHGYLGVDFFFIISGFVVLWSARGRSPARFGRARVLRLYPEFWLSVALSSTIFALVPGGFGDTLSPRKVLLNLTMIPQYLGVGYVDAVYWTLGVELKFYVLLWLVILAGQLRNIERLLYVWIAVSVVESVVDLGGVVRSLTLFPFGSLFAAGGVFFLAFESGWTRSRSVAAVACLLLSCVQATRGMRGFVDVLHITPLATATSVVLVCAMFATMLFVVQCPGRVRIGASLAIAGSLTYPLYLLHNTGRELFLGGLNTSNDPVGFLLALTFSLGASYLVLRLGTGPVRRILARVIDRVTPTATGA